MIIDKVPISLILFETALPATILAFIEIMAFINFIKEDTANMIESAVKGGANDIRKIINEQKLSNKEKYNLYMFLINTKENLGSLMTSELKKKEESNENVLIIGWSIVLTLFFSMVSSFIYTIISHGYNVFKPVDTLLQALLIIIGVGMFQFYFYFYVGKKYKYTDPEGYVFDYKVKKHLQTKLSALDNRDLHFDNFCSSIPN